MARVTTQYLLQNIVKVIDNGPAISADFNRIKKRLSKVQLDNVKDLQNAIRREWQRLPLGYIRRLVRSMRRTCDAGLGHTVGIHVIEPAKVLM